MTAFPPEDADHNPDFEALRARYGQKIFNVIYRYLKDNNAATELTQETFRVASRYYDRFRSDPRVFTWLYQIARNLCINRIREHEDGEEQDQTLNPANEEERIQEISDRLSRQRVEAAEMRPRLLAAIDALPPDCKQILTLRGLQDLSYEEIVEATSLKIENVKTLLSRARRLLRQQLRPYFIERYFGM